jgi:hypothetical protein
VPEVVLQRARVVAVVCQFITAEQRSMYGSTLNGIFAACRASYLLFALAVAQRLGRAWCIKAGLAPRALLPAACAPILVRAHFKSMAEYYRGLSVAAGSPSHRSFGALPHSPPLAIRET